MKIIFQLNHTIYLKLFMLFFVKNVFFSQGNSTCINADFETGNLSGWQGTSGTCCPINSNNVGIISGRHTIMTGTGTDPNTCNQLPYVAPGGTYSARLGNSNSGSEAEQLKYSMFVTSNNSLFIYKYAVVLEDPGHEASEQPRFELKVLNDGGQLLDPVCGYFSVTASGNIPGFQNCGSVVYKPWTTVGLDLTPYIGQNITLEFSTGDCSLGAHFGYAYIDASCGQNVIDAEYCIGSTAVTLSAPIGFTYLWSSGEVTQTINVDNIVEGQVYTCLMTSVTGCQVTLSATLAPLYHHTITSASDQTACEGAPISDINLTIGGGATGAVVTGLPSGVSYNVSGTTLTITGSPLISGSFPFTVTTTGNACSVATTNATLLVNPKHTITIASDHSTCENSEIVGLNLTLGGGATGAIVTGLPDGASYSVSGTILTIEGTPTITGSFPFMVTTIGNSCASTSTNATLIINQLPDVSPISDIVVCNSLNVPATTFSSSIPGSTFAWTNNNTAIGLGAAGNGNFSFTANNTTSSPIFASISVVATVNSCPGDETFFNIQVNPSPVIEPVSNAVLCNNTIIQGIDFTSQTSGTTFAWINDNTSIGLSSDGTGNISSFSPTNSTSNSIVSNLTVVPTASNCVGPTLIFSITIRPTPIVDPVSNITVCNSENVPVTNFSSQTTGVVYDWTNQDISIGLPSNGTGNFSFTANNITSFPRTATISIAATINSCQGPFIDFTITVNPSPITIPMTNLVVCNNDPVLFNSFSSQTPGSTFSWSNDLPSVGLSNSGAGNIPSFIGINATESPVMANLVATASANNCPGIPLNFTLTVNPTPRVNSFSDITICNSDFIDTLFFSSATNGTTFNWINDNTEIGLSASGSGNINGFYSINPSLIPIFSNIVVTPTANNCVGIPYEFTITVFPTPIVEFLPKTILISELFPVVNFENQSIGASSYLWQFGDGTISDEENPKHFYPAEPASYEVILIATNIYDCKDTAYAAIEVLEELIYYVPNSFTPNGDELNNVFQPVFTSGYDLQGYSLQIFDRWGELIFESFDMSVGWDGTYGYKNGGKIVQDGTYTYKIKFKTTVNEEIKSFSGHVNIIR